MKKVPVWILGLAFANLLLGAPKEVTIPFKQFKLKNGMTLILSEDHTAPTVFDRGGLQRGVAHEKAGRTGFAHLFEHMMFQGSANVAKGEHPALISQNGGSQNGTTDNDRTLYFENPSANQLDLGLFLGSGPHGKLAVSQANLDNQRNAVQEERACAWDNQPYAKRLKRLTTLAFRHVRI